MSQPDNFRCTNCQNPNPADATFCNHCKNELAKTTDDKAAEPLNKMTGIDETHKTINQTTATPGQVLSQANEEAGPQDQPQPSFFDWNKISESETARMAASENEPMGCSSSFAYLLCIIMILCFMAYRLNSGLFHFLFQYIFWFMNTMMSDPNHNHCTICQSPNPADAAFCTHCKSELVKPTYDKAAGTLVEMAGNDQTHETIDQTTISPGQVISQAIAETGPQDQPQPSLLIQTTRPRARLSKYVGPQLSLL